MTSSLAVPILCKLIVLHSAEHDEVVWLNLNKLTMNRNITTNDMQLPYSILFVLRSYAVAIITFGFSVWIAMTL